MIEKYGYRRMRASLSLVSKRVAAHFEIIRLGYELSSREDAVTNFQKTHLNHLINLMYTHILREEWEIAYRCFAILIRMDIVDLRSIWNLGSKILENYKHPAGFQKRMHEKFLEWMCSVYTSYSNFNSHLKTQMDPVFRSGSRTHVPNYVVGWLWSVLQDCIKETEPKSFDNKINGIIDKVTELVLRPPFIDDSEIWFIGAMSYFIKADRFSLQLNSNHLQGSELDISRNQVVELIQNVKNCLNSCTEHNNGDFQYPRNLIEEQLIIFEKRLYDMDDIFAGNDADLDHNEYEEEEEETDDLTNESEKSLSE